MSLTNAFASPFKAVMGLMAPTAEERFGPVYTLLTAASTSYAGKQELFIQELGELGITCAADFDGVDCTDKVLLALIRKRAKQLKVKAIYAAWEKALTVGESLVTPTKFLAAQVAAGDAATREAGVEEASIHSVESAAPSSSTLLRQENQRLQEQIAALMSRQEMLERSGALPKAIITTRKGDKNAGAPVIRPVVAATTTARAPPRLDADNADVEGDSPLSDMSAADGEQMRTKRFAADGEQSASRSSVNDDAGDIGSVFGKGPPLKEDVQRRKAAVIKGRDAVQYTEYLLSNADKVIWPAKLADALASTIGLPFILPSGVIVSEKDTNYGSATYDRKVAQICGANLSEGVPAKDNVISGIYVRSQTELHLLQEQLLLSIGTMPIEQQAAWMRAVNAFFRKLDSTWQSRLATSSCPHSDCAVFNALFITAWLTATVGGVDDPDTLLRSFGDIETAVRPLWSSSSENDGKMSAEMDWRSVGQLQRLQCPHKCAARGASESCCNSCKPPRPLVPVSSQASRTPSSYERCKSAYGTDAFAKLTPKDREAAHTKWKADNPGAAAASKPPTAPTTLSTADFFALCAKKQKLITSAYGTRNPRGR